MTPINMSSSSNSNSSRNLLLPILLETLLPIIAIIGLAFKQFDVLLYSIVGLLAIYILAGWYIFKTDKYRVKDIIFTELSIILFLSPVFFAFTYKILVWPGANEFILLSLFGGAALFIISIIWFFVHQHSAKQRLLGFNILARILVYLFLTNFFATLFNLT